MANLPSLVHPPSSSQYDTVVPTLEIRLEAATPIFMAGAHNVLVNHRHGINEDYLAEIRAASFRGALRYWYRAWRGAYIGNNLEALKKDESTFWGDTTVGAPFTVEVKIHNWVAGNRPMLVHGNQPRAYVNETIVAADFSLIFRARLGWLPVTGWTDVINIVRLLTELGGIGKRSRRGYGSLRIVNIGGRAVITSTNGAAKQTSLSALLSNLHAPPPPTFAGDLDYPVLHQDHCKIVFCNDPFPDYQQAMIACWNVMRGDDRYRDHWVFGNADRELDPPRLASPVRFNIVQSQAGYHIVLTAFKTSLPFYSDAAQAFVEEIGTNHSGNYILGNGVTW